VREILRLEGRRWGGVDVHVNVNGGHVLIQGAAGENMLLLKTLRVVVCIRSVDSHRLSELGV
jgi:hypothetical protein